MADNASFDFLYGVGASVISCCGNAVGLLLQKLAAQKQAERIAKGLKPWSSVTMCPWWIIGFSLMLFVPIPFDFIAYKFASQSLIVPLGSMSIVFTLLFSQIITGEVVSRREWGAVLIIITGCVVSTITGSHYQRVLNTELLLGLLEEAAFLSLLSCVIAMAIVCFLVTRLKPAEGTWLHKIQPVCTAYMPAAFGGIQNIFFKSVTILTADPVDAFTHFPVYLCITVVITLAVLQLRWINKGLAQFKATLFLPCYNTSLILLSTALGSIFYQEYLTQSFLELQIFICGCFLAIVGVIVIASTPQEKSKDGGGAASVEGDKGKKDDMADGAAGGAGPVSIELAPIKEIESKDTVKRDDAAPSPAEVKKEARLNSDFTTQEGKGPGEGKGEGEGEGITALQDVAVNVTDSKLHG